ncbi:hypothetical protein [Parelusimicrobium proximum]|uniref:hypothetical protein n=1 Tax=Parelusimicrobium proximum TaxID=3228953 RepID=UPI003D16806C
MVNDREHFFIAPQVGFSKEHIQKTRELFEPFAARRLSDEECAEIARDTINLELYLRELNKKYETLSKKVNPEEADPNGETIPDGGGKII